MLVVFSGDLWHLKIDFFFVLQAEHGVAIDERQERMSAAELELRLLCEDREAVVDAICEDIGVKFAFDFIEDVLVVSLCCMVD